MSKFNALAAALVAKNTHPKAADGLVGRDQKEIAKCLEVASSKSKATLMMVLFSFLAMRHGSMRFKNFKAAQWRELLPNGCMSDYLADALLMREAFEMVGVTTASELEAELNAGGLVETLKGYTFNTTAIFVGLRELRDFQKEGLIDFSLPKREEVDQAKFNSAIVSYLWDTCSKKGRELYKYGVNNQFIRGLTTPGQIELAGSTMFGIIAEGDLIIHDAKLNMNFVAFVGTPVSFEETIPKDILFAIKSQMKDADPEIFGLDFRHVEKHFMAPGKPEAAKPSTQQKEFKIKFLEVPEVDVYSMNIPVVQQSVERLSKMNQSLHDLNSRLSTASEAAAKREVLQRQIVDVRGLIKRLEQECEIAEQREKELLAEINTLPQETAQSEIQQQVQQINAEGKPLVELLSGYKDLVAKMELQSA